MKKPSIPENEAKRIENLDSYSLLDTLPEDDYDSLTALAAGICGTPISLVSLVDENRQWFKSHHGLDATETPRDYAFCAHVINHSNEVLIVNDARKDERFHDNPLVVHDPHIIFYAGVPIVSEEGYALGSICVIDHEPKELNDKQINSLKSLSKQITSLFSLRKNEDLLEDTVDKLESTNQTLKDFAQVAAHDLRSPLTGISELMKLVEEKCNKEFDEEGREWLNLAEKSSDRLTQMIDGLLAYSQSEELLETDKSTINIDELQSGLSSYFYTDKTVSINVESDLNELTCNKTVIEQVLINLVSNAVKYNDKDDAQIVISISESGDEYQFSVKDNGPGIPKDKLDKIFDLFEVLVGKDKYGKRGYGIGLATVKKIVNKLNGSISVESTLGEGTNFVFTIAK